jgi:RNA polymerase sigma-70 factor (ECF subfamily)
MAVGNGLFTASLPCRMIERMTEHPSLSGRPDDAAAQDLQWFRRARQGDYDAFEALVGRYQRRVYGLAWRILGQHQDAEDVTQQTFLSVLEHLADFREESSVATWVLRIAANHAAKVLRKKRGLPTRPLEVAADPGDSYATLPHPDFIAQWRDSPEELAERAEVRRLLDQALAELDDKYRLVFLLRDVEGLSTHQTAETLGLTEPTVKVRLLRARLLLRERLTRVLGDEATRVFPSHDHGGAQST